jgi:predicted acetyltransferase
VKLCIYPQGQLPNNIKWQVLDFLRIVWPGGFTGKNLYRSWITSKDHHSTSYVLINKKLVVSHAEVVWKYLDHAGVRYKTYGVSGVFTYPQFRKQGYAERVVKRAKTDIEKTDGDIVLFTSMLKGFYEQAGFQWMKNVVVLKGDPKKPIKEKEKIYMLFLSKKGKKGRKDLETKPVYFGQDMW